MKSFSDYLNEKVNTLDTLHDPGVRSYYSRHRVTPGNRKDFELIRKIFLITLESGPTARRRLSMLLRQLASIVPEVKPLVDQLGILNAQDERDAKKLFDPGDIDRDLSGDSEPSEFGRDDHSPDTEDDDIVGDEWEKEQPTSHPHHKRPSLDDSPSF